MLNVNLDAIKGKTFIKNGVGGAVEYTCIGVGLNPQSGALYVVGLIFDAPNNRTEIKTELFKDVRFMGDLTK